MAYTTNVMVYFDWGEDWSNDEQDDEKVTVEINRFFDERNIKGLVSIWDDRLPKYWYGGNKMWEGELLLGAMNYLDEDSFLKHMKSLPWSFPEEVEIFIRDPEERFRIFHLSDIPGEDDPPE